MYQYISKLISSVVLILSVSGVFAKVSEKFLLTPSDTINSILFLPEPPEKNSAAFDKDKAAYFRGYSLKGSPRWETARKDAEDSSVEKIAERFNDAFGFKISKKTSPYIFKTIEEITHDVSLVTKKVKSHYMRMRPFAHFHNKTCLPKKDKGLRKNGSYPSGHTTKGWAIALALSQINPSRIDKILLRGYDYGYSRVVCGAHWQSDVDAGYLTGAALFSRLNANPQFQRWIKKAQNEIR